MIAVIMPRRPHCLAAASAAAPRHRSPVSTRPRSGIATRRLTGEVAYLRLVVDVVFPMATNRIAWKPELAPKRLDGCAARQEKFEAPPFRMFANGAASTMCGCTPRGALLSRGAFGDVRVVCFGHDGSQEYIIAARVTTGFYIRFCLNIYNEY